jgi:hypothetical protein
MNTYRVNSSILPRVAEAKGRTMHRRVDVSRSSQSFAEHGIAVADTRAHHEFEPRRPLANLPPLQILVRPTPSIFIDDIGESDAADWSEPAHEGADRQLGIRVETGRQSERGLHFLLELQIHVVRVAPRPSALAASSMF